MTARRYSERTRAILAGKGAPGSGGGVHPPIQRASTLILPTVEDLYREDVQTYGLEGMEVHRQLKAALMTVEGGAGCTLAPSGLAACTLALLAATKAGQHVLAPDSVYGPTRRFCDRLLSRFGVEAEYYDPRVGAGVDALIRPETALVFLESPGSLTFEVQDTPAIARAAAARGVATAIDNTWSAGVFFKPFDHGVDLSIQALTKYQGGHADVLVGAVLARTPMWAARVAATAKELGLGVSPDDAYLCLRGMKTMHARLAIHDASARALAAWMEARPEVAAVYHPALPSHPDHALWARDFAGAAGLFAAALKPVAEAKVAAMLEGYDLFKMGFSWGGFESLVIPCGPQLRRTATRWPHEGTLLRYQVGLESPEDLIADLEAGFARLAA